MCAVTSRHISRHVVSPRFIRIPNSMAHGPYPPKKPSLQPTLCPRRPCLVLPLTRSAKYPATVSASQKDVRCRFVPAHSYATSRQSTIILQGLFASPISRERRIGKTRSPLAEYSTVADNIVIINTANIRVAPFVSAAHFDDRPRELLLSLSKALSLLKATLTLPLICSYRARKRCFTSCHTFIINDRSRGAPLLHSSDASQQLHWYILAVCIPYEARTFILWYNTVYTFFTIALRAHRPAWYRSSVLETLRVHIFSFHILP